MYSVQEGSDHSSDEDIYFGPYTLKEAKRDIRKMHPEKIDRRHSAISKFEYLSNVSQTAASSSQARDNVTSPEYVTANNTKEETEEFLKKLTEAINQPTSEPVSFVTASENSVKISCENPNVDFNASLIVISDDSDSELNQAEAHIPKNSTNQAHNCLMDELAPTLYDFDITSGVSKKINSDVSGTLEDEDDQAEDVVTELESKENPIAEDDQLSRSLNDNLHVTGDSIDDDNTSNTHLNSIEEAKADDSAQFDDTLEEINRILQYGAAHKASASHNIEEAACSPYLSVDNPLTPWSNREDRADMTHLKEPSREDASHNTEEAACSRYLSVENPLTSWSNREYRADMTHVKGPSSEDASHNREEAACSRYLSVENPLTPWSNKEYRADMAHLKQPSSEDASICTISSYYSDNCTDKAIDQSEEASNSIVSSSSDKSSTVYSFSEPDSIPLRAPKTPSVPTRKEPASPASIRTQKYGKSKIKPPSVTVKKDRDACFKSPLPIKKTPSKCTNPSLKDVISPVALYINNTPKFCPLRKATHKFVKVEETVSKNVPVRSDFKENVQTNSDFKLPPVIYKPAKHRLVKERNALELPNSIRKLVPEKTGIKHEMRINRNLGNESIERRLQESDFSIDSEDVSVLVEMQPYNTGRRH